MAHRGSILSLLIVASLAALAGAQAQSTVTVRMTAPAPETHAKSPAPAAVFWLEPLLPSPSDQPWPTPGPFRLLQKGRTFLPHVLVVPVGASVAFPHAAPYFHNVFSLFEGSRFDLGLYEAGSTRNVRFARKGISYIFCNIHPEMGAVVLSLNTPLWAMASGSGLLSISNVRSGSYEAHLWVEGQDQTALTQWTHTVTVPSLGTFSAGTFTAGPQRPAGHEDKFGRPYKKDSTTY